MAEKKATLADRAAALATPEAEKLDLSLWDVFFGKEGQDRVLRFTVDKAGGVGIDDCVALSRAVDPLLDEADLTPESYRLEVSSPGLCRLIHTDAQFAAYVGKPVSVRLIRPDEGGARDYKGLLARFDAERLVLCGEGGETVLARAAAATVRADDDTEV